jgi:hypothetical protein
MTGPPHLRPLNIVELLVASTRLYRNCQPAIFYQTTGTAGPYL